MAETFENVDRERNKYRREIDELKDKLRQVNDIIFGSGAGLGSDNYFEIRKIVAEYSR